MLLAAIALAAIIGFSLNRASICSVRAAAEILSSGRAYMMISIVKAAFWAALTMLVLRWLTPWPIVPEPRWKATWLSVAGGLMFGVGAAVNGGCALSTLSRLGEGEFGMLLTLATMLATALGLRFALGASMHPVALAPAHSGFAVLIAAALGAPWATVELVRLWRLTPHGAHPLRTLLATSYRLSGAALLIGLCNGVLFSAVGPWTFTSAIERDLDRRLGLGSGPTVQQWILFVAVLLGAAASALHRKRFQPRYRPSVAWLNHIAGGTLMGAGAAVTPGGNDTLILQGIPSLSPHAAPALVGMFAGILLTLKARRALGGTYPHVLCSDDRCVEATPMPTKETAVNSQP